MNEVLKELNAVFDQKRANDCCFGHEIPNIQTQQAMRDALNKEADLIVEDFSSYSDEKKGLWVLKLNLKKSFQKDFDKLLLNGFDDIKIH